MSKDNIRTPSEALLELKDIENQLESSHKGDHLRLLCAILGVGCQVERLADAQLEANRLRAIEILEPGAVGNETKIGSQTAKELHDWTVAVANREV